MDRLWQRNQRNQRDLAEQIGAPMVIAKDSGHHIQKDRPELVLRSVEAVVAAVRDGRSTLRLDPDDVNRTGGILIF